MRDHLKDLKEQYSNGGNLSKRINLHERFSTNKYGWQRWVFDQIYSLDNKNILELGTGIGDLWLINKERIPGNWQITLSDLSEGMIADAKTNLIDLSNQINFQVFDAQTIPFEDGSFDYVIANHMLYHVKSISKTLAEIKRVLASNGILFAATNGVYHMHELNNFIRNNIPGYTVLTQSFTLENGKNILKSYFNVVNLHRYENSLLVTDLIPLYDYLRSMVSLYGEIEKQMRQIKNEISREFDSNGNISITVDGGLFKASK